MSELGKPPKIARPTARTVGGVSRPAGSTPARPTGRPAGGQSGSARPAPSSRPSARPAARPADLPGAVPVRRPRPRPGSAKQAAETQLQDKSLVGLGNLLKTKREIHGLTRRDVVVKIKIPLEQLEAIEDGRLSSLPPVFAKGFLRAYANELGLEAETILEDYRQMTGGFKNEPASREPLSAHYVESSVGAEKGGGHKWLLITLGLLVFLALVLYLWPGLRSSIPLLGNLPGFKSEEPSTPPPPKEPSGDPVQDKTAEPGPSTPPPEDDLFVGDPISEPVHDTMRGKLASPVVQQGGTLILVSREDKVWVEVLVDDKFHEFLLLKAGEPYGWKSERQITITTGQANALNVNWNGQDLGVLSNKTVDEVTFPKR